MQETVSESLDGMLDARAFDNIHADTNHAHLNLGVGRETPYAISTSGAFIRDN